MVSKNHQAINSLADELERVGSLHFQDDMLEEAYFKKLHETNIMRQRISCVVGVFICLLFMPQDLAAFPDDSKALYLLIRVGITIPFLLLGFGVSFIKSMRYQLHNWVLVALILLGVGSIAIVVINYHYGHISPYEGVILTIIAAYFMVGLDFRSATVISLVVAGTYVLSVLSFYEGEEFAIYNLSFVISTFLICAAGAYELEKHLRINFLNNRILTLVSERDGLTGVLNRKAFDKAFANLLRYSSREKYQVLLMLIDVDYFKRYNDNYGHVYGDECLKKIARAIEASCRRPMDISARYGGEEFVICWLVRNNAAPEKMIRVVRNEIKKLGIEHLHSDCSDFITVSGGVTSINFDSTKSISSHIEKADKALYEAKAQGRNKILFA